MRITSIEQFKELKPGTKLTLLNSSFKEVSTAKIILNNGRRYLLSDVAYGSRILKEYRCSYRFSYLINEHSSYSHLLSAYIIEVREYTSHDINKLFMNV